MFEIDRIAVIVKPTTRMVAWLKKEFPEHAHLTLDEARSDCTTLLIPAFDDLETAEQYIAEIYSGIFENELELWSIDEDHWPTNRTLPLFSDWFDIEFHSMVLDLGDLEEIEKHGEQTTSLQ